MTEQNQQDSTQDKSEGAVVLFDRHVTSTDGQQYRFVGDNQGMVFVVRDGVEVFSKQVPLGEVWDYERYSYDIVKATKNIADQYIAETIPGTIERRQDVQKMLGYTQAEAREKAAEAAAVYKRNPTMLRETLAVAQFWATMAITAPERSS